MAKFDREERTQQEWKAIRELRKLDKPPQAMLPYGDNNKDDKVIIYRMANPGGHALDLGSLLQTQILSAPENCLRALDCTFQSLDYFYISEAGAAHMAREGEVLRWGDVFGKIEDRLESQIYPLVAKEWPGVNWRKARDIQDDEILPLVRSFPNPLQEKELHERLDGLTGRIMLSRIHGNVNLSNILIEMNALSNPETAFIINLARYQRDMPTAIDFARIETEFWHQIFAHLGNHSEQERLEALIAVRDCLEGRRKTLPWGYFPCEDHALRLVCELRTLAARKLRADDDHYCLKDYITALYFSNIQALSCIPSVASDPARVRVALLGAALSLQFLQELEVQEWYSRHYEWYSENAFELHLSPLRKYQEIMAKEIMAEAGIDIFIFFPENSLYQDQVSPNLQIGQLLSNLLVQVTGYSLKLQPGGQPLPPLLSLKEIGRRKIVFYLKFDPTRP